MLDNPELIDKYEAKLQGFLTRMHTDGIGYDAIHFVLKEALDKVKLQIRAEAELSQ